MGGSVAPAPECEIGWKSIWSDDPLMISEGPWFQFHYDRWKLPPGAKEIARNPNASQAFIINNSLAVQFHPEVTSDSLSGWLTMGGNELVIANGQSPDAMLAQTKTLESASRLQTFDLIDTFLSKVAKLI